MRSGSRRGLLVPCLRCCSLTLWAGFRLTPVAASPAATATPAAATVAAALGTALVGLDVGVDDHGDGVKPRGDLAVTRPSLLIVLHVPGGVGGHRIEILVVVPILRHADIGGLGGLATIAASAATAATATGAITRLLVLRGARRLRIQFKSRLVLDLLELDVARVAQVGLEAAVEIGDSAPLGSSLRAALGAALRAPLFGALGAATPAAAATGATLALTLVLALRRPLGLDARGAPAEIVLVAILRLPITGHWRLVVHLKGRRLAIRTRLHALTQGGAR